MKWCRFALLQTRVPASKRESALVGLQVPDARGLDSEAHSRRISVTSSLIWADILKRSLKAGIQHPHWSVADLQRALQSRNAAPPTSVGSDRSSRA